MTAADTTARDAPVRGSAQATIDALDAARDDQRRRAMRALLANPLLSSGHDDFVHVRRHAGWLREWLAKETGWALRVDPEVARVVKMPADDADGTRPAVTNKQPFTRRRYVLLCLALAALEKAELQISLGRLGEAVIDAAADPALAATGFRFALERRDERSDLVAAVRLLIDYAVLSRVAGDEHGYVSGAGDALYDVDRHALAGVLATARGPSTVDAGSAEDRLAAIRPETPPTDEGRVRALRHGLTRRLLDDPVVYYADLTEDERGYLTGQRSALIGRVERATGLVAEVRAEGIAMVDPASDPLTDLKMPEVGTDGHLTLLLAERLATSIGSAVPVADLERLTAELASRHRSWWRRDAAAPGAERELCRTALDRLTALGLLRPGGDREVVPLPAVARFALGGVDRGTATLEGM
ncbi:MAG TPA: TIGR02678 family protein [Nocardioidaceae bacterium]|nr:TIGR02678 family protein [Nocardioidaceae bacterium]